jgi:deoxyguanosine kinase
MMQINILEGARGTGKSTLAFKLRQTLPETTLINPTGFHTDGAKGLVRVYDYYMAWMRLLFAECVSDNRYVFDRFFFTEQVFSKLYKNYNFNVGYNDFAEMLEELSLGGVKINIFHLTIDDEEELKERLTRDKVPFANVSENVEESMKQQEMYRKLFNGFNYGYCNDNMVIHTIDTSNKTNDHVYAEIIRQLKTSE